MDSILALIIVFWIVSAFSKALNPKKRAKQAEKNRTAKHTGGRADKPLSLIHISEPTRPY